MTKYRIIFEKFLRFTAVVVLETQLQEKKMLDFRDVLTIVIPLK
jgi:hypothetical protein